jgi:hypothetical protein
LQLNLAVIKVDGPGFVPVHLSPDVVTQGSNVIGIVYMPGPGIQGEASVVGSVAAIDARHIFFQGIIQPGGTGGPLLSNTGDMVGLMDGQGGDNLVTAIRSDVALAYLKSRNIL